MMEKALLLSVESDDEIKSFFIDTRKYADLHDELLWEKLKATRGQPQNIANKIWSNLLYFVELEEEIKGDNFELNERFLEDLDKLDDAELADKLSQLLCEKTQCAKYDLICDIVKSRVPKAISMDRTVNDEPLELKDASAIIRSIESKNNIKVYLNPENELVGKKSPEKRKGLIKEKLNDILRDWA